MGVPSGTASLAGPAGLEIGSRKLPGPSLPRPWSSEPARGVSCCAATFAGRSRAAGVATPGASRQPPGRGVLAAERGLPSRPLASELAVAAATLARTEPPTLALTEPGATKNAPGASTEPPPLQARPGPRLACAAAEGESARSAEEDWRRAG